MKKYRVIEGLTGILEIKDEKNNVNIYRPDCDLDKAQELLYEFYELKTINGNKVKDSFQYNGVNWFPTSVSMLYWQYFYQVVKYKSLLKSLLKGDADYIIKKPGKFRNLIVLFKSVKEKKSFLPLWLFLRHLYHFFIQLRNKYLIKKNGDILFFRYGIDDFRTQELFDKIKKSNEILQIAHVPINNLYKNFFKSNIYILCSDRPNNFFKIELLNKNNDIFNTAIQYVNNIINTNITNYFSHKNLFDKLNYKIFFGIDDTNIVYPILYAAKDVGIKSLGFQHGVYAKRHVPFFMNHINKYQWYDKILLWGEYWKKVACRNTTLFPSDYYYIASNKHYYDYQKVTSKDHNKSILIPYEFLTDTIMVGNYIKIFLKKGYDVFFKIRSDEKIYSQLSAYYIDDLIDKVKLVKEINPKIMSKIDIIAGTQTTLLYDLLPYNKPIWILDTPFRLLHDMVEDGLARLITMKDLINLEKIYMSDKNSYKNIQRSYFSGNLPIEKALSDYLQTGKIN